MQPPWLQQMFSEMTLEREGEMEETQVSLLISSTPYKNMEEYEASHMY